MKIGRILLFVAVSAICVGLSFSRVNAQTDAQKTTDAKEQTASKVSAEKEDDSEEDEYERFFNIYSEVNLQDKKPTLELQYSSLGVDYKEIPNGTIAGFGVLDGRIGYVKTVNSKKNSIFYERANYIYFGYGATSLGMINTAEGAKTTLLRFGIGERSGRGWKFGDAGLVMYYGTSMIWSDFSLADTSVLTIQPKMNDFHDAFRFGKFTEGGAAFKIGESAAITLGYEQTVIFPRHLPFYWIMSETIEGAAQEVAERFTRAVSKSSPQTAPIIGFLLHNGIGIGAGLLKKNRMNWPFDTAPALLQNGMRLGVSFRF